MNKWYHFGCEYNAYTPYLVVDDEPFSSVARKILYCNFLFCIDAKGKFIGVISPGDIVRSINQRSCMNGVIARDIANADCVYATTDDIDDRQEDLKKFKFLPVVDSMGYFRYFVSDIWLSWSDAQEWELAEWRKVFQNKETMERLKTSANTVAKMTILDPDIKAKVINKARDGIVIEVGAGPFCGFLGGGIEAREKIVIEPLAERYAELRNEYQIDWVDSNNTQIYSKGGDSHIAELTNKADLTICHNALDHTPDWPFVLGNIASYTKKGGMVYLFTDINRNIPNEDISGHYNITYNPEKFFRLVENFGFKLIYKGYGLSLHCSVGISLVAIKE